MHRCSFHHRQLHEGGFRVAVAVGGELTFANRYGVIVEAPRQAGSADELLEELSELGISAGGLPRWNGDPIDYGLPIAGLFDVEREDLERPARSPA